MGYYTRHDLEILNGNDYTTDYKSEISELAGYGDCFDDRIKWYNHEEDMRTYSQSHPNVLFKLSGDGEENGDLWVEYYFNGKMQREKIEVKFEPFDKSKLS